MGHEAVEHVLEAQRARLAVVDGQHVDAEVVLQRREGEEVVEDHRPHGVALDLDDDAHPVAVALVADVADALELLVAHQLGDALDEPGLVHLERNLGDEDRLALGLGMDLDDGAPAHLDRAAAGLVSPPDLVSAVDEAPRRKVGARHERHQIGDGAARVLDQVQRGVDDLHHVVGWNVGGHSDRDAGRAVDEQVRKAGRQDERLLFLAVVVGDELDGFLVDVGQQGFRQLRHANLGVAHGGGRIAVDGAEVALAVDERIAQREVLRHAHDRVVDRNVAVGMVLADDVAHDAGRFLVGLGVGVSELLHREQDATVHGLEAVAHIRQRAAYNHRHRVVEIRPPHLVFDVDRNLL